MDIKFTFLNGFLNEEMYVKRPSRFESFKILNHVFNLHKSLYGLEQAPRVWYERLSKFLLENDFTRRKLEKTVNDFLIIQVYMDDIIFGATY